MTRGHIQGSERSSTPYVQYVPSTLPRLIANWLTSACVLVCVYTYANRVRVAFIGQGLVWVCAPVQAPIGCWTSSAACTDGVILVPTIAQLLLSTCCNLHCVLVILCGGIVYMLCVCVCVCVCLCVRACVRACMHVCLRWFTRIVCVVPGHTSAVAGDDHCKCRWRICTRLWQEKRH